MPARVIIDTNVFVYACQGSGPANRVIHACLLGRCQPLMGAALLAEYEDVLGREALFARSPLSPTERGTLLDVFLGMCEWNRVYFGWRPNLPDEADNHLIELAVAGNAHRIVTRNLRDLTHTELHFPQLKVLDPKDFLKELESWQP